MPEPSTRAHLCGIHAEILGQLQRQFAASLQHMAQHIEAADVSGGTPEDTRYHLQRALAVVGSLRATLHQIALCCGALEAAIR